MNPSSPGGRSGFLSPLFGLRCIRGSLATGLHLPGTWGVGSPSALRGQVTANWPFEAKSPSCTTWRASSQYSDLKMQMPWILATSGDRTERNRWVESTPLPAYTKTKGPSVSCINLDYLACLSPWPQMPSSETFPITLHCTESETWTAWRVLCTNSLSSTQPWVAYIYMCVCVHHEVYIYIFISFSTFNVSWHHVYHLFVLCIS